MSAEIMERAEELAAAIADSQELADMREKEMDMNDDPEAVVIIREFREKQQHVYDLQMQGNELSEADKQDIAAIEEKMSGNPAIRAYITSSEKFEELLKGVNMVIAKAIAGDAACGCGADGMDGGCECPPGCSC